MIHFFDLPREVRDMIYVNYVFVQGGYVLDFDSNRLRSANRSLIDLTLRLTCKTIAKEMKGVPLSSNTLNFSTFLSEEHRTTAGRFHLMLEHLYSGRGRKWEMIQPNTLSVPDDVWTEMREAHPRFAPYLDSVRRRPPQIVEHLPARSSVGPPGSCGETPSVFRGFIHLALQVLVSHKHRLDAEQLAKFERGEEGGKFRYNEFQLRKLVDLNPDVWIIPTAQRVKEMISSMGPGFVQYFQRQWYYDRLPGYRRSPVKYRYSAAAVAIRFLESLPKDVRSSIRRVVLNEDYWAVGFSECHGLGLISYCQENPGLRVERRVSLWRTVFQTKSVRIVASFLYPREYSRLEANSASHPVALWITEALQLAKSGMPPGLFTLVFEGDDTCSEIFQTVVRRDAAWQTAIDVCMDRGILPPLSWEERRQDTRHMSFLPHETMRRLWYLFEDFPQAIKDIVAGNSVIKCNFEVGEQWIEACDVEQLVKKHKHWNLGDWESAWSREGVVFEPDTPTPSWLELVCDKTWETELPVERYEEGIDEWLAATAAREAEFWDTWDETSWVET